VRWDIQGIIRALYIDTPIKKGPFRLRTVFLPFLKQIIKIKIIFTTFFAGYGYNGEYFGYIYIYIYHHHVQEGLGLIPVPCILKMKLVPPSLPR